MLTSRDLPGVGVRLCQLGQTEQADSTIRGAEHQANDLLCRQLLVVGCGDPGDPVAGDTQPGSELLRVPGVPEMAAGLQLAEAEQDTDGQSQTAVLRHDGRVPAERDPPGAKAGDLHDHVQREDGHRTRSPLFTSSPFPPLCLLPLAGHVLDRLPGRLVVALRGLGLIARASRSISAWTAARNALNNRRVSAPVCVEMRVSRYAGCGGR